MDWLDNIDLTSILIKSMITAIEPLTPYLVDAVISVIMIALVKRAWHSFHNFVYLGESARERRKAHKRIDTTVDFISNIADLFSSLKSNSKRK